MELVKLKMKLINWLLIIEFNKIINSKKELYKLIVKELEKLKINLLHQEKLKLLMQFLITILKKQFKKSQLL